MALIICNNCGKKISDTTNECIHCGAKIGVGFYEQNEKLNNTKKADINESNSEESDMIYKYYSLSFEKQERLENDFLEFDKQAAEWQEKASIVAKFLKIAKVFLILAAVAFSVLTLLAKILPEGVIDLNNERASICLASGIIGYAVEGAICLIIIVVCSIMNKLRYDKKKQYVYYRRFSKWLEEKNVIFDIKFLSESDKRMYDKIDLDVDTF